VALPALILGGCGSNPNAASEANFKSALEAHYSKFREYFSVGSKPNEAGFIFTIRADESGFNTQKKEFFDTLASTGVLDIEIYKRDQKSFSGQVTGQEDYLGYKISKSGEQYFQNSALDTGFFSTGSPKLCYGRRDDIDVTNFTEPAEALGVKVSNVKFNYKIIDVPTWATNASITQIYKWLPEKTNGAVLEDNQDLVLTNNGWVHHSEVK